MEDKYGNLIDLRKIFEAKAPKLMKRMPNWLFRRIQRLLHEEDINRIFTKFERVDLKQNSTIEGTGLGLAICKRIVEHCGGTIALSRSFNLGGACFTVKYPKA